MAVIQPQPPPEEFLLWSVGDLSTEYGGIPITRELLRSGYDNWEKRGRALAFSYEHPKVGEDNAAPAWCALELRNGGNELWATNIHWTQKAALAVGAGEWIYVSPEFHPGTDFVKNLDFKKIGLTADPATWGIKPIVSIGSGREYAGNRGPSRQEFQPVMAYAIGQKDPKDDAPPAPKAPDADPSQQTDQKPPADGPPPADKPKAPDVPAKGSEAKQASESDESKDVDDASKLVSIFQSIAITEDIDQVRKLAAMGAMVARQLAEKEALEEVEEAGEPEPEPTPDEPGEKADAGPPVGAPPLDIAANAAPVSPFTSGKGAEEVDPKQAARLSILDKHFADVPADKLEGILFGLKSTAAKAHEAVSQLSIAQKTTEVDAKDALIKAAFSAGKVNPNDAKTIIELRALSIAGIESALEQMPSFFAPSKPAAAPAALSIEPGSPTHAPTPLRSVASQKAAYGKSKF